MTVDDTRTTGRPQTIPQPRAPQDDVEPEPTPQAPAVGGFPWPEPWRSNRGARPRSEYWDAATASWHSRGPVVSRQRD
jgi:hypothetical protein